MSDYRDAGTCEVGHWEPSFKGCPVCGPDGPCKIDPEGFEETRRSFYGHRRRWRLLILSWIVIWCCLAYWAFA